ncbi:unnamed protein product [Amoebophrya sp. A120]|nr:unnamed protein product [Amoebophrya sp. A120]|eukprot:GSA120T00024932001.1
MFPMQDSFLLMPKVRGTSGVFAEGGGGGKQSVPSTIKKYFGRAKRAMSRVSDTLDMFGEMLGTPEDDAAPDQAPARLLLPNLKRAVQGIDWQHFTSLDALSGSLLKTLGRARDLGAETTQEKDGHDTKDPRTTTAAHRTPRRSFLQFLQGNTNRRKQKQQTGTRRGPHESRRGHVDPTVQRADVEVLTHAAPTKTKTPRAVSAPASFFEIAASASPEVQFSGVFIGMFMLFQGVLSFSGRKAKEQDQNRNRNAPGGSTASATTTTLAELMHRAPIARGVGDSFRRVGEFLFAKDQGSPRSRTTTDGGVDRRLVQSFFDVLPVLQAEWGRVLSSGKQYLNPAEEKKAQSVPPVPRPTVPRPARKLPRGQTQGGRDARGEGDRAEIMENNKPGRRPPSRKYFVQKWYQTPAHTYFGAPPRRGPHQARNGRETTFATHNLGPRPGGAAAAIATEVPADGVVPARGWWSKLPWGRSNSGPASSSSNRGQSKKEESAYWGRDNDGPVAPARPARGMTPSGGGMNFPSWSWSSDAGSNDREQKRKEAGEPAAGPGINLNPISLLKNLRTRLRPAPTNDPQTPATSTAATTASVVDPPAQEARSGQSTRRTKRRSAPFYSRRYRKNIGSRRSQRGKRKTNQSPRPAQSNSPSLQHIDAGSGGEPAPARPAEGEEGATPGSGNWLPRTSAWSNLRKTKIRAAVRLMPRRQQPVVGEPVPAGAAEAAQPVVNGNGSPTGSGEGASPAARGKMECCKHVMRPCNFVARSCLKFLDSVAGCGSIFKIVFILMLVALAALVVALVGLAAQGDIHIAPIQIQPFHIVLIVAIPVGLLLGCAVVKNDFTR